jgi:hypothetical protein
MNSSNFREITVLNGFKIENGVFGLDRDVYLSIVKFLDSSRGVGVFCSTLALVKNHIHE